LGRKAIAKATQWQPILSGSLADEVARTVTEVAEEILERRDELSAGKSPPEIAIANAETALFYGYLAQARGSARYEAVAADLLFNARSSLAEAEISPWLYDGLAGVAWMSVHLDSLSNGGIRDDVYLDVDCAILDVVTQKPWTDSYDLIYGLVGLGIYFLERLPDSHAETGLNAIIDRLEETVEITPAGFRWLTRPDWLSEPESSLTPHGYYALGMAHGIAGVISFLASLFKTGIARERAKRLLEGSVKWLVSQQGYSRTEEKYPRCVGPGVQPDGFFGWCWGDAGIAAALIAAACALDNNEWRSNAIDLASNAARQRTTRPKDSCLCHGAAGHGHIFNRLYQATMHAPLKEGSIYWFERALDLRRSGEEVLGGFAYFVPGPGGEKKYYDLPGFLIGASGTALALLAATTATNPGWDRRLLLSTARIE